MKYPGSAQSVIGAFAATLIFAACAAEPPKSASREELIQKTATVESINLPSRLVTLRGEDGGGLTVVVDPVVRNLDQVKVGDKLVVSYYESLAAEVKKPGEGVQGVETEVVRRQGGAGRKAGRRRRRGDAHDRHDRIRGHLIQHGDLHALGWHGEDGRGRDDRKARSSSGD